MPTRELLKQKWYFIQNVTPAFLFRLWMLPGDIYTNRCSTSCQRITVPCNSYYWRTNCTVVKVIAMNEMVGYTEPSHSIVGKRCFVWESSGPCTPECSTEDVSKVRLPADKSSWYEWSTSDRGSHRITPIVSSFPADIIGLQARESHLYVHILS